MKQNSKASDINMSNHLNKWLLAGIVLLGLGWIAAELEIKESNARVARLSLGEVAIEARDAVTDELLKTSIKPPPKMDGLPLLNIVSPDGFRWKVLFASDVPLTFRIAAPGYTEESVTVDADSDPSRNVQLRKVSPH